MNRSTGVRQARIVTVLGCALALPACHRTPEAAAPPPPVRQARKPVATNDAAVDPAVAEANRTMAAGVPMGTTTAPVEVRFDVPRVPVAGQPFEVRVAVLPQALAPVLRIEIEPSEGLAVTEPEGPLAREKVGAGTLERVTVKASSATPGTRILTVKVTLELPTGAESRAFAFPLVVRAASAGAATKAAKSTP
jgi:hypothetical protein